MKNILITGGCGFIGSNFLNYMVQKYPEFNFFNVDKLDYCASLDNISVGKYTNYTFYKCDLNDANFISFILETNKIDTIIHFAAQSHVDTSFDNSIQYTIDNIMGTHVLLDCVKKYGISKLERFIHISTDEVYGEVSQHEDGCLENKILNPTNPYSATKAAAEMLVNSYYYSFKLPIIITRSNNVYGPNQYHEKLIPKFIYQLSQNQKCTIHGDGSTRRNFIHAHDVSTAIEIILMKGNIGQIYNIGSENEYSVVEIAKLLIKNIHNTDLYEEYISYITDRPFNDFRYSIDCKKLKQLGWTETKDFMEELYVLSKVKID
jgi:dTDP-glucose 4,6-dehydratase